MALAVGFTFIMSKRLLSVPVSCYKCRRQSCVKLSPKTLKNAFMRMLGWHLWRCTACRTRFYLRRLTDAA